MNTVLKIFIGLAILSIAVLAYIAFVSNKAAAFYKGQAATAEARASRKRKYELKNESDEQPTESQEESQEESSNSEGASTSQNPST